MTTFFYTHPAFFEHQTGAGHPESPFRLTAIAGVLRRPEFAELIMREAPRANRERIELVHTPGHVQRVFDLVPSEDIVYLDPDTVLSPGSAEAALRAVGAVCDAVDAVFEGKADNAFCGVRPPGHHAMPEAAMGFCLFNNIAVGAAHARRHHGIKRVAIVDFDVHHGNGSEDIFWDDERVLMCSIFERNLYPFCGDEPRGPNMVNIGLPARSGGEPLRQAVAERWLPALAAFRPQLIYVSAGFDGHREDDMGNLGFVESDYEWVTRQVMNVANTHCAGRVISCLEGGYVLSALARSVAAHVKVLIGAD